jgi:Bacterial Ig domain/Putative Ig domain
VGRLPIVVVAAAAALVLLAPAGARGDDLFVIAYGDTISDGSPGPGAGNIEVGGTQDVYTFQADAGDDAILDALTGGAGTFRWRLERPDGTAIFDGLYVDRRPTLPLSGTYTLSVRGSTSTTTGTYSFRLLLAPLPQTFAIAFGDMVSDGVPAPGAGNLEGPGAVDVYAFDALGGQGAILDLLTGNNVFLRWRLEAPDGSVLFDATIGDQQAALPQTGTYHLVVSGNAIDDSGTYSFRLLLVPPGVQSFAIAFGDTVSDGVPALGAGNLEAPGAIDVYTFDAVAGQEALLDTLVGDTGQFRWTLEAPDGTLLFDDFYLDRQQPLPQTGTYTLTVHGLNVTDYGTYSFRLLNAPANNAPVAGDDEVTTAEDTAVTVDVLANDSDPDGDPLTVTAFTQPAHGSVTLAAGTVTYTPDADFYGADAFGYTVGDGEATDTASVAVTVTPVNDAPVAADDAAATDEDEPVTIDVLANDLDLDGDALVVLDVTQPATGTVVNAGGDVIYTQAFDFSGTDTFTYTAGDGNGGTDTATVVVTVNDTQHAPTVAVPADQASTEGDDVSLQLEAADPDGDTLTFAARGLPPGLEIDPATGVVSGRIEAGGATGSPYTVSVTATDPSGRSAVATFVWTVGAAVVAVAIDIKPGETPNCVRDDDHGVIPVAVLGSARVDAALIDPATVELEGLHVRAVSPQGKLQAHLEDVDGDGLRDLVVQLERVSGTFSPEQTVATLTARLLDGTPIAGTDSICLVPAS